MGRGRGLVRLVVDLQRPPEGDEPERLRLCTDQEAARAACRPRRSTPRPGPACTSPWCGPQFETPAEVAWLAGYGAVVGMSAAPEARAAAASGVECCLLALVANVAAAAGWHDDVLAAGGRLCGNCSPAASRGCSSARWPDLLDAR